MEEFEKYLEGRENLNRKDEDGNTSLHRAALMCNSKECAEITENIGPITNMFMQIMISLLKYGADYTLLNNKGETFLDCIRNEEIKEEMNKYVEDLASLDIKEPSF